MREDVEKNMENLGMQMPNYGLHLFPGGGKAISEYKIKVIEDSIIANGWEEVHFFDDRLDWLTKASDEITTMFPNIKFYKHFVNNIKSKLSL